MVLRAAEPHPRSHLRTAEGEIIFPVGIMDIIASREQHLRHYWNPGSQKSPEAHGGAHWPKWELTAVIRCNSRPLFLNLSLLFLGEYSCCVHCK